MPYAVSYTVPAPEPVYWRVKEAMGPEPAEGMIALLVMRAENGLRHIAVWEDRESWDRFQRERVTPAVAQTLAQLGRAAEPPTPPAMDELALVDVMTAQIP